MLLIALLPCCYLPSLATGYIFTGTYANAEIASALERLCLDCGRLAAFCCATTYGAESILIGASQPRREAPVSDW